LKGPTGTFEVQLILKTRPKNLDFKKMKQPMEPTKTRRI